MSKLLHELLIESAKKFPDKTSVTFKDDKISYRVLDTLTNQLSSCLLSKDLAHRERIGLYIDKSIDAVTAIFGSLKAGGCYVPLDPLAPVERQLLIINDCSLKYLITTSKKLFKVRQILKKKNTIRYLFILDVNRKESKEEISGITVLYKDEIFGSQISKPLQKQLENTDLAYILYTSGSTGQPKGVMISHSAAFAFVEWMWKYFNITSNDIVSSHAPFHFDLSIFDIFSSIMAGSTICLVPQGLSSFPKSLADFIENQKISTWYSVPSILTQLLLHGGLEERDLPSLRLILFAGEVFPSKYLRKLMEILTHVKFYNLYGPTETNVITYYYVSNSPDVSTSIPIGMPCDGVKKFIVDKSGDLVNEGGMGELYVSAPTVMNGYWNDSQKTGKVLFKGTFPHSPYETVYKTGDLVSINPKGELKYHGRSDNMIKSRGYRIELGEIQTALSSHMDIEEVAVFGIPDDEIGNKIKAVIASKKGSNITVKEIKHFCSKKLPHYMVPELIVIKDFLPKTSTGKIDRKKLEKELV